MAQKRGGSERVDINQADEEELTRIEGIDVQRARLIVQNRERHGEFESWEDFEAVVGIGPALTEKAQEAATLGSEGEAERWGADEREEGFSGIEESTGVSDGDALGPESPETLLIEAAEEGLDEVEVLTTLARLDLEAAMAYDAGLEGADEDELRRRLTAFRDDHLRHVHELNGLLKRLGVEAIEENVGPSEFLLRTLAMMTGPLGPSMLVVALLANEQLTNGSYATALEYEWEPQVVEVLARGRSDEQRHREYLIRKARELGAAEEPLETGI